MSISGRNSFYDGYDVFMMTRLLTKINFEVTVTSAAALFS